MSKKKKVQQRDIPAWLSQGSQQAVGMARDIAQRPYTPFTDQRVASFDPNEQRAYDLAATEGGAYRADLDRSRELAERGSQSFLDADIEAYQNPFIKGALEPAARELREEGLRRKQTAQQEAGMASAFGGSRAAIIASEASGKSLEAISDLYARGYAMAFESAANRFEQDRVAARASSDQFRNLGSEGQRMLSTEMNNLLVTGGLKRSLDQAGLDFDYQQFIEARDWDITNLQPLLAALSTVPHGETMTTSTEGGEFQAILGAAATVTAAYFTGGMSLVAQGAAEGGPPGQGAGLYGPTE